MQAHAAWVCKKFSFAAAHYLPGHPTCGELHGHNYAVELALFGEVRDNGMVIDFGDLKSVYKDRVHAQIDHRYLNMVVSFIPTAENLAAWIHDQVREGLDQILPTGYGRLRVRVWENPDCYAEVFRGMKEG